MAARLSKVRSSIDANVRLLRFYLPPSLWKAILAEAQPAIHLVFTKTSQLNRQAHQGSQLLIRSAICFLETFVTDGELGHTLPQICSTHLFCLICRFLRVRSRPVFNVLNVFPSLDTRVASFVA